MSISGIGRNTTGRLVGLCVVGIALAMGGCNKAMKEENASLLQESAQLREQNQALQTQLQQQQTQLSQIQAAQRDTGMGMDSGGDYPESGGGRSRGRSQAPREVVIEVAGDVLFDSGQATLKSTAKKELDGVVSRIQRTHSGRTVRIEGHTDSDPIRKSKWGSNEALSKARADAVRDYLVSRGISRGSISTVGMGSSQPRGNKKDSRRVEIVVVDNE